VNISHKTAARRESFNNSQNDYLKKEFQNIALVSITFTADEPKLVRATAHKSGIGIQTMQRVTAQQNRVFHKKSFLCGSYILDSIIPPRRESWTSDLR
jgi:hypothetical protein